MTGVWPWLIYQAVIAYGGLGVLAALAFLLFGLDRIDHGAAGAYAFRPLLLPGLIMLWPVVLLRWRRLCR